MQQVQVQVRDGVLSIEDGIRKEIPLIAGQSMTIGFSDGTALRLTSVEELVTTDKTEDDEEAEEMPVWRITKLFGGSATCVLTEANLEEGEVSDRARLESDGQLTWAAPAVSSYFGQAE